MRPDREERRGRRSRRELQAIEVGEVREHPVGEVAPRLEVLGDLAIRVGVGDVDRPAPVAHERDVDGGRAHPIGEAGDRERQPAALALAGDDDPVRVDERVRGSRIDGEDGVRDEPPVVVGPRVVDALGS